MDCIRVNIKSLYPDLPVPGYATTGAAGIDLLSAVETPTEIKPGRINLIPTGICLAIPEGYEGQVRPRSGLALKYGLTMVNTPGTIDADYRGEVKVVMINLGQEPYIIQRGERIAQLVFNKSARAELNSVDTLDETDRGSGGFGSTGV
ncbi:MAG TPA: dUTP diphosphatase [Desulfobacteria bacterium]|nr:dUTP diphosphatase [Desulfobacteria bacterium]